MALNKIWARRNVQSVRSSLVSICHTKCSATVILLRRRRPPFKKVVRSSPLKPPEWGLFFFPRHVRVAGGQQCPAHGARNAPRVLKSVKRPPVRAFVCHNHTHRFFSHDEGTLLFQKEWTPFWGTAPMGPIRPCARMTAEPSSMLSTLEPNLRCADQRRSTRCLASRDPRRPPTFALFYFSPVNGEGTARWRCGSCFCAVRCSGRRS